LRIRIASFSWNREKEVREDEGYAAVKTFI